MRGLVKLMDVPESLGGCFAGLSSDGFVMLCYFCSEVIKQDLHLRPDQG